MPDRIPRIIIQTSPDPAPDHVRDLFALRAPSWDYRHFTDACILDFFHANPSPEFPEIVRVFNRFDRGEHKADLFRYYFLYLYGGLFMDMDAAPEVDLDEVVGDRDQLLIAAFDPACGIYNGILGATAGSPLIHMALRHIYHTPAAIVSDSYHYFCKSLQTFNHAYPALNGVVYQEINMVDQGVAGSIVVDHRGARIFTHYWQRGSVPEGPVHVPAPVENPVPTPGASSLGRSKFRRSLNKRIGKLRRCCERVFGMRGRGADSEVACDARYAEKFTKVYAEDQWGCGSGPGSSIENTGSYNDKIRQFLRTAGVRQVTDVGCGDWQSSHLIYDPLQPIDYLGIDCVAEVIASNKARHPDYAFKHIDVVASPESIRSSEVYIIKDVLQHLRIKDIYKLLDALTAKQFKCIIVTNCKNQQVDDQELPDVDNVANARGLSAAFYPLKKYAAVPLFEYNGGGDKQACIIFNRTAWNDYTRGQVWAFTPDRLELIDAGDALRRVGPQEDGGYVIYSGLEYDGFLSCGIANDLRFEEAFCDLYPGLECLAFDGTIKAPPQTTRQIRWVSKNIAVFPREGETDLQQELHGCSNAFVKMDIEGSEFDWIQFTPSETLNRIAQLVIEVHWPFDRYRFQALMKLADTHVLVHVHGNNYSRSNTPAHLPSGRSVDGTIQVRDAAGNPVRFPEVFEATYVRKDLIPQAKPCHGKTFPTALDRPNCPGHPDIRFSI